MKCSLCPRNCQADREKGETGFCGCTDDIIIARSALHMYEEPCICGKNGSGTIFFSGCNLRCVFCQNYEISHNLKGRIVSQEELLEIMLKLQNEGAENINLVTPTHFADQIASVLKSIKPQLHIPVVYNCGGYESVATLAKLRGLIDIYMPDFKYMNDDIAMKYSSAPHYAKTASEAVIEMFKQTGAVRYDKNGKLLSGLLVRHLVLPSCRKDSIAILHHIAEILPVKDIRISIMSQYTPDFLSDDCEYANLRRRITNFEYRSVCDCASLLNFEGYTQERQSASSIYTPEF